MEKEIKTIKVKYLISVDRTKDEEDAKESIDLALKFTAN